MIIFYITENIYTQTNKNLTTKKLKSLHIVKMNLVNKFLIKNWIL